MCVNEMGFEPGRAALLLMDLQEGIVGRHPDVDGFLGGLVRAREAARAAGLTVGYVRVALTAEEAAAIPATSRFAGAGARLDADSPATQIDPRIAPAEGELVVRKKRVGAFSTTGLYLRWKQTATFSVSRGDWSGLLSARYSSGYADQLPDGGVAPPPPGFNPRVASYTIFGLSTSYTGIKNATLTFGILNLFDRDPPFTAHNVDYAVGAGWDPRVADPRGRTFTLAARYKF